MSRCTPEHLVEARLGQSVLRLGNVFACDTREFNRDLAAVTCDLADHFALLAAPGAEGSSPSTDAMAFAVRQLLRDEGDDDNNMDITVSGGSGGGVGVGGSGSVHQRWLFGDSLVSVVGSASISGWAELRLQRVAGETTAVVRLDDVGGIGGERAVFHALYRGFASSSLVGPAAGQSARQLLRIPDGSELVRFSCDKLAQLRLPQVHPVGLVYVDQQQDSESELFSNSAGSARYSAFLRRMATPRDLLAPARGGGASGGTNGGASAANGGGWDGEDDGRWLWELPLGLRTMVFHAVTAMRVSSVSGSSCGVNKRHSEPHEAMNRKKRLVGNDLTTIVYQEAGGKYGVDSIATQCLFGHVVAQPLAGGLNRIRLLTKDVPGLADALADWCCGCLVSETALPLVASQVALLADMAGHLAAGTPRDPDNPGGNVCLARLLQLRRVRRLVEKERRLSGNGEGGGGALLAE